jgi:hypothetical protein
MWRFSSVVYLDRPSGNIWRTLVWTDPYYNATHGPGVGVGGPFINRRLPEWATQIVGIIPNRDGFGYCQWTVMDGQHSNAGCSRPLSRPEDMCRLLTFFAQNRQIACAATSYRVIACATCSFHYLNFRRSGG